jgi:polyferredoxin
VAAKEPAMALSLSRLRAFAVQPLSFALLLYGGRFGLHLGAALPCFACPYVAGCGGYCYLMGLQGVYGFGMGWATLIGPAGGRALGWFALFVFLAALLGKAWCGWICPFGTLSDWMGGLRKKLGLRESRLSAPGRPRLGWIKYALLAALVALPPLVTAGWLSKDAYLPFCQICPGKSLLPLFAGDATYLSLNVTNNVTLAFSAALLAVTGLALVGSFFKDRFFCFFCPMLALIHLARPLAALRLVKKPERCAGCGNCRRNCAMEVERVYLEKEKSGVPDANCVACLRCVEVCPSDDALGVKWFRWIFSRGSRRRAARLAGKERP